MDELFRDILYLEHLKTFKLNHMHYSFFKEEWMASLGNLSYLSLASNTLRNISVDLFEFSSGLISLDLNDNQINSLKSLFVSFLPIQANLKELKLSSNGISTLDDFPMLNKLEFLDLSKNNITWIAESTFRSLSKLNYLNIDSNSLKTLHTGFFSNLENLLAINLSNNQLEAVPVIFHLNKLQSLDLSNQNGQLKIIENFAFERSNQAKSSLSINLDRNEMLRFGDRSFCSRHANTSQMHELIVSYSSVK